MRLIDADALIKSIEAYKNASDMPPLWYEGIEDTLDNIRHEATAEAIPVEYIKKRIKILEGEADKEYDGEHLSESLVRSWELWDALEDWENEIKENDK